MKKIRALGILGFIICTGFKKPITLVTDYRDTYVGTYNCKCYTKQLSSVTTQLTYRFDTTTTSISVAKDALDSVLQITVNGQVLKAKLVSKHLYAYPTPIPQYGGGFYATDSIGFYNIPNLHASSRFLGKKTGP